MELDYRQTYRFRESLAVHAPGCRTYVGTRVSVTTVQSPSGVLTTVT